MSPLLAPKVGDLPEMLPPFGYGRTQAKAIKFKGFQTDLDMVPLGPLKTAHSEVMEPYKTIVDRYDGTVYPNIAHRQGEMRVVDLLRDGLTVEQMAELVKSDDSSCRSQRRSIASTASAFDTPVRLTSSSDFSPT
jgi:hypothetical protein